MSILEKMSTSDYLRKEIRGLVDFKYSASLFNEIVAHMLKHAFLDVVINFNFEETLDEAVRQEIHSENYHHIINDGNCVDIENILVDGRLQNPVYIKPHGTFSQKSTLRYTDTQYFGLPEDIKIMLRQLISGSCGKKFKPIERVNLILVGFAMGSVEFNDIVDECLPAQSIIYHIDYAPESSGKDFFKHNNVFSSFTNRALKARKTLNDVYKPLCTKFNRQLDAADRNQLTPSLGEFFSVLWRVQNDLFKQAYKPRSIARHELVSYLFYEPRFGEKTKKESEIKADRGEIRRRFEESSQFFLDHLMVEFFLSLNRSNGILDVVELLRVRSGYFYNKYRETFHPSAGDDRAPYTIFELLHAYSNTSAEPVRNLLKQSQEFNRGANIFTAHSAFQEPDMVSEAQFAARVKKLLEQLTTNLDEAELNPGIDIGRAELQRKTRALIKDLKVFFQGWYKKFKDAAELSEERKRVELMRLGRAITLFCRLLGSHYVSTEFKLNFFANYQKLVFNGRRGGANDRQGQFTMLQEIFRLLEKSWGNHYFVIDARFSNPAHNLWESFYRKNIIHTNLARAAIFNNLLVNKDWDVFLTITETGSFLNLLRHLRENLSGEMADNTMKKMKKRHFIIICSYESIKQLYPEVLSKDDSNCFLEEHAKLIRVPGGAPGEYMIDQNRLSLLVLPFNQHNHHVNIFLETSDKPAEVYRAQHSRNTVVTADDVRISGDGDAKFLFDAIGSIYFYRRGLSNNIDPIYIGLNDNERFGPVAEHIFRDQIKLLDIFVKHLNRSFKFEMIKRHGHADFWPKADWLEDLQDRWENGAARYKDITTLEFLQALYMKIYEQPTPNR